MEEAQLERGLWEADRKPPTGTDASPRPPTTTGVKTCITVSVRKSDKMRVNGSYLVYLLAAISAASAATSKTPPPTCGKKLGRLVGTLPVSTDGWCGLGLASCPADQCCDQYGKWCVLLFETV